MDLMRCEPDLRLNVAEHWLSIFLIMTAALS